MAVLDKPSPAGLILLGTKSRIQVIRHPSIASILEDVMDDATGAAGLLLKLFELRTDPALRQARAWFAFEFHPNTAQDVLRTWLGPGHESAPYRMVTSYWDMAAALVTQGAIPATMFNASNTEHFAVYAKLRPFLVDVRAATSYPDYLLHIEKVVHTEADPESRISIFARYVERQRKLASEGKQRSYLTDERPTTSDSRAV